MAYFTKHYIDFFKGLKKNNKKDWFDENRKIYESEVKKPFKAFVDEMIARINKHDPQVKIEAKDAMFRINKDIRFSKDKTPYNTHMSANISRGGRKSTDPGFYFQFGGDKVMLAGGAYMTDKDVLQRIRTSIAENPKEFSKIISDPKFKSLWREIQGEKNKVIPKEFKETAEKQPLIANKQFYYMVDLPAKHITDKDLADKLMEYYEAGKKVNGFLRKAMEG